MSRRLIIEEEEGAELGRPEPPPGAGESFDLQDACILAGILFSEGFAWWVWRPATLMLAAFFCFFFAIMIGRANHKP